MKSQWSIKLPSGEYLDTPADFNIQFEFNNQVFSTGDASVLPGTFSFPVSVTLTPKMAQQLGHPHRIDTVTYFQSIEGVLVCVDQNPMFLGKLIIEKAQGNKISLSIVVNPLSDFKKTDLDQLDLGGDRDITPHASVPVLALDTADHPEDYDFVFFTVLGAEINDWPTYFNNGIPWFHQNFFDVDTGAFTTDSGIYSPFVKIEYLLQQIFAGLGEDYDFQNAWQSTIELRRLYLYNNVDMRQFDTGGTVPELLDTFTLNRHVPKIPATEFLKKLTAQWCLGMFANHFKRTFRLVPLATVLGAAAKWNWSNYIVDEPSIEAPEEFPANFNYTNVNTPRSGVPAPHNAEHFDTYKDYTLGSPTNRYVHIESHCLLLDRDTPGGIFGLNSNRWKIHAGYFKDELGDTFDPGMAALFATDAFDAAIYESSVYLSRWEEISTPGGSEWTISDTEYPVALMFYRGIQNLEGGGEIFPLASNHVWKERVGAGARVDIKEGGTVLGQAEWSLNWEGEYGLYNKAWKQWHVMLRQGKHVTQAFNIPLQVLREFSFEDKVRINNMEYFLKQIKVQKLLANGMVQIEVSMVSLI